MINKKKKNTDKNKEFSFFGDKNIRNNNKNRPFIQINIAK